MPAARPPRSDYVHWEQMTTRWADVDVYGHMNNARYFELIDTVVNNHLVRASGTDIRDLPAIGVVAEVSCRYFAEVTYPDPVDLGALPDGAVPAVDVVEGRFVHVYVDNTDPARPVVPVPDVIRAAVAPLERVGEPG